MFPTSFEYTARNFFRYSICGKEWFDLPPDDPDEINFKYGFFSTVDPERVNSYRIETLLAAKQIASMAGPDLTLMMGGGIDSEAMFHAFRLVGADFRVMIINYENRLKQTDVAYAVALCQIHDIPYEIYQIDPLQFWYNMPQWLYRYKLSSPALYLRLWVSMELRERFQVWAEHFVFVIDEIGRLVNRIKPASWYLTMAWAQVGQRSVQRFHTYRPEQIYALIQHPFVQAWRRQAASGAIADFSAFKSLVYQYSFPEICYSRPKMTGEEQINNHIVDLWQFDYEAFRPFHPVGWKTLEQVELELTRCDPENFKTP